MAGSLGTYRAIVVSTLSKSIPEGIDQLSIVDLPRKPIKSNEIRVVVHASAINYFDLLILIGRYQHKPTLPYCLGSESSGVVSEVGKSVRLFKVGDEVFTGMSNGNGNAEEMVGPAQMFMKKPKSFTHAQAAAISVGYMTAFHGLVQRGHLQKGEFLLVTGAAGGMGAAAIQLGKVLGATVIAAASSQAKLDAAKQLGADYVVNYETEDLKKRCDDITGGKFVDVVYEIVGGNVFDQCVRCMAPGGRLLVIGFAGGKIPSIAANLPLVKGFSVVGVRAGAEMLRVPAYAVEMTTKLAEYTAQGHLAPHVAYSYSLDQFRDAYRVLANREVVGKACVLWKPAESTTTKKAKL